MMYPFAGCCSLRVFGLWLCIWMAHLHHLFPALSVARGSRSIWSVEDTETQRMHCYINERLVDSVVLRWLL
jgi:hypothetical protein